MKVEAIIPAAGLGARMGGDIPKPLVKICGRPILIRTLEALAESRLIGRMIIAVAVKHIGLFSSCLKNFGWLNKRVVLVAGGRERRDSVNNCLDALSKDTEVVLVHDAARPFIDKSLIDALIKEAASNGAAIAGVPVKNTIKKIVYQEPRTENREPIIIKTINRNNLWEAQTPQVFKKKLILKAYREFGNAKVTDDASLVERLGVKVRIIQGSYSNIKITTPEDLVFAEALLSNEF